MPLVGISRLFRGPFEEQPLIAVELLRSDRYVDLPSEGINVAIGSAGCSPPISSPDVATVPSEVQSDGTHVDVPALPGRERTAIPKWIQ